VSSVEDVEKLQVENTINSRMSRKRRSAWTNAGTLSARCTGGFRTSRARIRRHLLCNPKPAKCREGIVPLVDVILVIGSPNSSNSNRLRELGNNAAFRPISSTRPATSIRPGWKEPERSESPPAPPPGGSGHGSGSVLEGLRSSEVEELTVIEEDVEFLLPKELVQIESASKSAASIVG